MCSNSFSNLAQAAKRALDTVEEFVPTVSDLAPTQFMATGYSKVSVHSAKSKSLSIV